MMSNSFVGMAACAALVFAGCRPSDKDPDLVFHCTFDDEQSILVPAAGLPGKTEGAKFVEGKVGKALYVPAHAAVAEFPFPNGLPTASGTIEFWAKLEGGKETFANGVDPYFFIVTKDGAKGWNVVFECNFNANNGCGASGFFCGMSFGRAVNVFAPDNKYASILGMEDPFGWHKYTIAWSRAGLDENGNVLQVSIDDKLVGKGICAKKDIEDFFREIGGSVRLVFSNPKSGHGKSPVAIDDFKMWSVIQSKND